MIKKHVMASTLALLLAAAPALATEYTKAVVKKVDLKGKKVTLIHEEMKNLEMPAMTMVFRTADDTMLGKLSEGQNIEFVAERVNGKITIVDLK